MHMSGAGVATAASWGEFSELIANLQYKEATIRRCLQLLANEIADFACFHLQQHFTT